MASKKRKKGKGKGNWASAAGASSCFLFSGDGWRSLVWEVCSYGEVVTPRRSCLPFFFFSFSFYSYTHGIWSFPGKGSDQSCSCLPTPQPQQHGIQAAIITYTAAHGNTESLTHWASLRAWTWVLTETSWVHYSWATMGTLKRIFSHLSEAVNFASLHSTIYP